MDPAAPPNTMQRLRGAGLKPTVARISVWQAIDAANVPTVSIDMVIKQLAVRGVHVSVPTVYRTMRQFEESGLLLREDRPLRKVMYRLTARAVRPQ